MQICRVRVVWRCVLTLITGIWLGGCGDSGKPILRGIKPADSELVKISPVAPSVPSDIAPSDNDKGTPDTDMLEAPVVERGIFDEHDPLYPSQTIDKQHTRVARRLLDLNLPNEITRGDIHAHTEPQWRNHAMVGETQTFPNFFERKTKEDETSPVDFSGKVYWEEAAENLTIPPLNAIEGLELEISVKTR